MSLPSVVAASLLTLGIAAGTAFPAGAAPDPLAAYRWTKRVLLVVAADGDDPSMVAQREAFRSMAKGAGERDLVLVEATGAGSRAAAVRRSYDLEPRGFMAVLIGKDGGVKLRSPVPLHADELFSTIDAMPMRQSEMRRAPPS